MKKITRRSFLTVCGAVAAAAALSACGGSASSTTASSAAASSTAASSAAASAAGDLSGNVATGGSTSMKNVIAALTEGFAEVQPGVTVSYDPTGSGAGITGATDKTLDIGLSSRALKADETGVTGTTIALDGIAIIVNKDSKVEDLTVDQLKQMFTGEITNWSEVGGDDGEIVLVGREAGSGTRDGFESIVDVKDACKYAQELTATGAVISAVEANPLAIGYASLSAVGDTVKAVTVEGVECSEDTVKDGTYKIQRPFVFVTNDSAPLSEQAQAFFDFATSTDAADADPYCRCRARQRVSSTFAKESDRYETNRFFPAAAGAAPQRGRVAGSHHELPVLPLRHPGGGLRRPHLGLHDPLRACRPSGRSACSGSCSAPSGLPPRQTPNSASCRSCSPASTARWGRPSSACLSAC